MEDLNVFQYLFFVHGSLGRQRLLFSIAKVNGERKRFFNKGELRMLKKNIYIMYVICFLQGMVFYGPIATLYRQAEGVSILQITIIESISLALCILLELPWGILADKIGYKKTMIICCMLYFVSKIVFWKATGFGGFLAERCMLSVVIAGLSGVDTSILYLSCEKEDSQRVFGIYDGLGMAGLLFASFVYSAVIGERYKMAGFLTMISYGIAAILSLFLVEVKKEEESRANIKEFVFLLKSTLSNKYLFMFLIGIAVFNESHQTITVFLNQLQYVRSGMAASVIGYVYTAATILGLCSVFSARFTKVFGKAGLMRICYVSGILACILLAITCSPWISVGGIFLLRIVFSLAQPLQNELQNRQVQTSNRATALSINAVIIDGVAVGTNVVFGSLAKVHLPMAFVFGAILCLTGLMLFEIWNKGTKKEYTM